MTPEEKAKEAEISLREATREAHAAIKDLRAAIREGTKVVADIEKAAQIAIESRLEPVIKQEVETLGIETKKAMDASVDKVSKEFDRLEKIFLGTEPKHARRGEPSMEDLILQKKRQDAMRDSQ